MRSRSVLATLTAVLPAVLLSAASITPASAASADAGGGSVTITGTITWQETTSINVYSQTETDTKTGTFTVDLISTVPPPDLGQQWHNVNSTYSVTDNLNETFLPNSQCPATVTGSVTASGTLVDPPSGPSPANDLGADWPSPSGSPVGFNIHVGASEQQTFTQCGQTSTTTAGIDFHPFCGSAGVGGTFQGMGYIGTIPIDCTGTQTLGGGGPVPGPFEFITDSVKGLLYVNQGFTVTGSDQATGGEFGQAGKQGHGSVALARVCRLLLPLYLQAEAVGRSIVHVWQLRGLSTAAQFLAHFLDGSGTAINLSDGSSTASEIENSLEFKDENDLVMQYIAQQVRGGARQIKVPNPPLHVLMFDSRNNPVERDLYYAFRDTNGIDIKGSGNLIGNTYSGSLTYTISESYGFNTSDYLYGIGAAMRFLQTTCGAPYFRGGAQWFPVTVTITEPIKIPVA